MPLGHCLADYDLTPTILMRLLLQCTVGVCMKVRSNKSWVKMPFIHTYLDFQTLSLTPWALRRVSPKTLTHQPPIKRGPFCGARSITTPPPPGADDAAFIAPLYLHFPVLTVRAWRSEAGSLASFTPSFPASDLPVARPLDICLRSFNPDPRSKGFTPSCINSSLQGTPYATIVESVYITLMIVKTSP